MDERDRSARPDPLQPRGSYYINKFEDDPVLNPHLVGTTDETSVQTERADIEDMLKRARAKGLPASHWRPLEDLEVEFAQVFSMQLSAAPAKVKLLKISLNPDAGPIRVKIRNYSLAQSEFVSKLKRELVSENIICASPSSKWACAPVVVSNPGSVQWRFTVDLSTVNKITIPFQLPMPNVERNLTKKSS